MILALVIWLANRIASGPSLRGCKPQVRRPRNAALIQTSPNDWFVVRAKPAGEYLAETEMRRVGMTPYLPQYRMAYHHRRSKRRMVRMFPLFLGYLFAPARGFDLAALQDCDGIVRTEPILADQFGRPIPVADSVIAKIRGNEECGAFDDLPGKHRLSRGEPIQLVDTPLMEGVIKSVRSLENVRLLVKLFNTEIEATVPVAKLRKAG